MGTWEDIDLGVLGICDTVDDLNPALGGGGGGGWGRRL